MSKSSSSTAWRWRNSAAKSGSRSFPAQAIFSKSPAPSMPWPAWRGSGLSITFRLENRRLNPMAKSEKREAPEKATKVLEGGDIFFAYRPKIDKQIANGIDDLQRLYMILHPRGKQSYRLLILGEKRLPSLNGGGDRKTWGFVAKVAARAE